MLRRLLKYYVYSNIHISISASLFCASAFVVFGYYIDWIYLVFVFCGTILIYNLHRIIGLEKIADDQFGERHRIQSNAQYFIYGLLSVTSILGTYCFLRLGRTIQLVLIPALITSLFYVTPLINGNRLRDIDFAKIILISAVWSYFFIVPALGSNIASGLLILIFFEKFLFVLAITIPFDIRDKSIDQSHGLKTLATEMDETRALSIAQLFLFFSFSLVVLLYFEGLYNIKHFLGIGLSAIISIFLIRNALGKNEWYFLAYLDGVIGLHGLIIIILSLIH